MSVRVAVIGSGIMGADHARIIAEDIGGVVLQLICDASEARARRVADDCAARDVSNNPFAVMKRHDVDATGTVSLGAPMRASGLAASEDYPADWRQPFADAYRLQNKAFIEFTRTGLFPARASIARDGYYATIVAQSTPKSLSQRQRLRVTVPEKPGLYR